MKKFLLWALCLLSVTIYSSCEKNSDLSDSQKIAQDQLLKDYSGYNVTNIQWTEEREYLVASFLLSKQTKAAEGQNTKAWYDMSAGDRATRVKDAKAVNGVPDIIRPAFEATEYADSTQWKIDEIELEEDFLGNSLHLLYEMELVSLVEQNLEAELYFDAETGELLKSTEKVDEDDRQEKDSFIVDEQLKAAVEALYPGAVILDAELEDGVIEVDAVWIDNHGAKVELELYFSLDYKFLGEEQEQDYTYATLPEEFKAVKEWFAAHPNVPEPEAETPVEVESELENNVTVYEIEIEYISGTSEYEITFVLDENYVIQDVEVENENEDEEEDDDDDED